MANYFTLDHETATDLLDRSIALNPNLALSWHRRGWVYLSAGLQVEEAIDSFERGVRLSPLDPVLYVMFTGIALSHIVLGHFEEAIAVAKRALRQNQTYGSTYRCPAAAPG